MAVRPLTDQRLRSLASAYLTAKEAILSAGYASELDWQEDRWLSDVSETDFLREAAWVVLSSGMSEKVVAARFGEISAAFRNWRSARAIVRNERTCREEAIRAFGHVGKIEAIFAITRHVAEAGFAATQEALTVEPVRFLRRFPFLGPVTSLHLAKNLGVDLAKPDRHLQRVALATGYPDPESLCRDLADVLSERTSVVDIVIWRHAILHDDYVTFWATTQGGKTDGPRRRGRL